MKIFLKEELSKRFGLQPGDIDFNEIIICVEQYGWTFEQTFEHLKQKDGLVDIRHSTPAQDRKAVQYLISRFPKVDSTHKIIQ